MRVKRPLKKTHISGAFECPVGPCTSRDNARGTSLVASALNPTRPTVVVPRGVRHVARSTLQGPAPILLYGPRRPPAQGIGKSRQARDVAFGAAAMDWSKMLHGPEAADILTA